MVFVGPSAIGENADRAARRSEIENSAGGGVSRCMQVRSSVEAAPLVIDGRFTSPPPTAGQGGKSWTVAEGDQKCAERRLIGFGMQAGARSVLPEQRALQACLRCRRHGVETIGLIHKPMTRSARFDGLQTCGSVWMCPVCAAKVSEERRRELSDAVDKWWSRGYVIVMVTYTVRHKSGDRLRELVAGMMDARGKATGGTPGQKLYRRYNVVGSVRALEVTHRHVNGWHPHIHELLFLELSEVDPVALQADLFKRWSSSLERSGMRDVTVYHGVDVRIGRDAVADYVAKYGQEPDADRRPWGVDHELSKHVVKKAATSGRSPMQLLQDYSFEGDIAAGQLFAEYGRSMKGRRQLFWSKGLRDLLDMKREKTDEEAAAEVVDQVEEELARLDWQQMQRVLHADVRAEVLNLVAVRDVDGLRSLLRSLGIRAPVAAPASADEADPRPQAGDARPAKPEAGRGVQCVLELVGSVRLSRGDPEGISIPGHLVGDELLL